jgi:hypothetical protein
MMFGSKNAAKTSFYLAQDKLMSTAQNGVVSRVH